MKARSWVKEATCLPNGETTVNLHDLQRDFLYTHARCKGGQDGTGGEDEWVRIFDMKLMYNVDMT